MKQFNLLISTFVLILIIQTVSAQNKITGLLYRNGYLNI